MDGGCKTADTSKPFTSKGLMSKTAALSEIHPPDISDEEFEGVRQNHDGEFYLDISGYEGPLDLLLELAKRQKVDLANISILALANQYLAFIQNARKIRLDIAGDYLIMAAWLAYLKSRLILPSDDKSTEPNAAELAENLAEKLRYLKAMREAAKLLFERPQFGRDLFGNGAPEGLEISKSSKYKASLHELLLVYATRRREHSLSRITFKPRTVWSLKEARTALEKLAGAIPDWTDLDQYLVQWTTTPAQARTVRASTFSASLEMTREGLIEMRQAGAFAPIQIRQREPAAEAVASP